jgi:hypothetical protein
LELETWNLELGTWNLELETWNLELLQPLKENRPRLLQTRAVEFGKGVRLV